MSESKPKPYPTIPPGLFGEERARGGEAVLLRDHNGDLMAACTAIIILAQTAPRTDPHREMILRYHMRVADRRVAQGLQPIPRADAVALYFRLLHGRADGRAWDSNLSEHLAFARRWLEAFIGEAEARKLREDIWQVKTVDHRKAEEVELTAKLSDDDAFDDPEDPMGFTAGRTRGDRVEVPDALPDGVGA